jgi:ArsR family transcriptional regulator, arsenate/arsenite/antimonite-responsive transcriptional repressor
MAPLNTVFKALGDPTRMAILQLLREQSRTPSELLERIQVTQPTLSHHLDILKRADLVETRREGQYIHYSLNMTVVQMAMEYFLKFHKRK